MAGCKSLWETEDLTRRLSTSMRRLLRLPRRLPDATMRDALCRQELLTGLRAALHRAVRAAWRRKALEPVGPPIGVLAFDGKVTALPSINGEFAQTQPPEHGEPYGLIRTVTCALVSAAGRPCIDVIPIPAHTNEMGHFQSAFTSVARIYGALFQMVTYDAGALSEANGRAVVEAGKDYLFALKNEHRTMFKLATELLAAQEVAARTEDVLDNQTTVTRTLTLLSVDPSWSFGEGKGPEESVWRHAKTFLRVESLTRRAGVVVEKDAARALSCGDPALGRAPGHALEGAAGAGLRRARRFHRRIARGSARSEGRRRRKLNKPGSDLAASISQGHGRAATTAGAGRRPPLLAQRPASSPPGVPGRRAASVAAARPSRSTLRRGGGGDHVLGRHGSPLRGFNPPSAAEAEGTWIRGCFTVRLCFNPPSAAEAEGTFGICAVAVWTMFQPALRRGGGGDWVSSWSSAASMFQPALRRGGGGDLLRPRLAAATAQVSTRPPPRRRRGLEAGRAEALVRGVSTRPPPRRRRGRCSRLLLRYLPRVSTRPPPRRRRGRGTC